MKRILLFLCLVQSLLLAQDETLLTKAMLFSDGGEASLLINNQEEWHVLGLADLSLRDSAMEKRVDGERYRLRFRLQIENGSNADMAMVQLRYIQGDRISLFNLELDSRDIHDAQFYTNWYEPPESFSSETWKGPVSIRILSAPGRNTELELDEIELELWGEIQKTQEGPQVVLADSGTFIRSYSERQAPKETENIPSRDEISAFSLKFIDSMIQGDLPAFYASLAEDIFSLNSGHSYSRYRIAPPEGVEESYSIEQYSRDFQLHIFNYSQFIDLFPQWAEPGRNWQPGEDTYLVMGSQNRKGDHYPFKESDMLVFMVSDVDGQMKVVARPEF